MNSIESQKGEIVMYQPDETIRLEVKVENETVWLTQQQMAELFLTTKQNISLHVNNIFKEDELEKDSVVKESLTTATDGKKYKTKIYNLDVIISVGYRVKSLNGTKFRRWANSVLKQYLLKGYAVNQRMFDIEQKMVEQNRSQLPLDIQRHNQQYPPITVNYCQRNHDRFLIIDDVVYIFGASLKDAGKKLFAYIKMQETSATDLLSNIR